MMENKALKDDRESWESDAVVRSYSAGEFFLFQGERLAFTSCFSEGWDGKRVLDLGCGGGRTTFFLEKEQALVIGLDISHNLIRAAKARSPHSHFQVGDASALPFESNSFDAVLFSFNSLDCLFPKQQRNKSLREIYRVLKRGGRFILSHHSLSAFFFGWYMTLRPKKLLFRLANIVNGNVFKAECYIVTADNDCDWVTLYYTWPNHFIGDLTRQGFELMHIFPNSPMLGFIQRKFGGTWYTKLADPWPYYTFQKR